MALGNSCWGQPLCPTLGWKPLAHSPRQTSSNRLAPVGPSSQTEIEATISANDKDLLKSFGLIDKTLNQFGWFESLEFVQTCTPSYHIKMEQDFCLSTLRNWWSFMNFLGVPAKPGSFLANFSAGQVTWNIDPSLKLLVIAITIVISCRWMWCIWFIWWLWCVCVCKCIMCDDVYSHCISLHAILEKCIFI